jgi:hypothetical protein
VNLQEVVNAILYVVRGDNYRTIFRVGKPCMVTTSIGKTELSEKGNSDFFRIFTLLFLWI